MHDLSTISKLNAAAFAEAIDRYRKAGRYVIAEYAGLHLMSIETFSTEQEAFEKFATYAGKLDSTHAKLLAPFADSKALYPPLPEGYGVSPRRAPVPAMAPDVMAYDTTASPEPEPEDRSVQPFRI